MRVLLCIIFFVFSVNASNYYLTIEIFPVNKTWPKEHEMGGLKDFEIWFLCQAFTPSQKGRIQSWKQECQRLVRQRRPSHENRQRG